MDARKAINGYTDHGGSYWQRGGIHLKTQLHVEVFANGAKLATLHLEELGILSHVFQGPINGVSSKRQDVQQNLDKR
jgi:hypothetical protein